MVCAFGSYIISRFTTQITSSVHVESSGFVVFLGVTWILQETTKVRILRYIILFIGKCNFVAVF